MKEGQIMPVNVFKRIVVYGAEMSGVCAAIRIAEILGNQCSVTIINPTVSNKLGGLATAGGLNAWDRGKYVLRDINGAYQYDEVVDPNHEKPLKGKLDYGGTFKYILELFNHQYGVFDAEHFKVSYKIDNSINTCDLNNLGNDPDLGAFLNAWADSLNITVLHKMDIWHVDYSTNPYSERKTVSKIYLKSIYRDEESGCIKWGRQTKVVEGDYFIDSSDDGKLTSLLTKVTVGRFDWPAARLDDVEKTDTETYVARQQAATLYFKLNNIAFDDEDTATIDGSGEQNYKKPERPLMQYNYTHFNDDYIIKTYNMGRNGNGLSKNEWWTNTLLLFKVDGRAHYRDLITRFYPGKMISDTINRDEAWKKGKRIIKRCAFINALRDFVNLGSNAEIVRQNNKVVVADSLYLRETVHLPVSDSSIANGTESTNYAMAPDETMYSGYKAPCAGYDGEGDKNLYDHRIGVAKYSPDIHPYLVENYLVQKVGSCEPQGNSHAVMRPDYFKDDGHPSGYDPLPFNENPVYVPYEVLIANKVQNLLVAGNASCICSFSWGEMRVLPNLILIGDAAGIILSYCIKYNLDFDDIEDYIDEGVTSQDPSIHEAMMDVSVLNGNITSVRPVYLEKPIDRTST